MIDTDKLRALDEAHRDRLVTTLRNWQREMERSCDALRELGPEMEDAAMGNAHVAEALEEAADAILAMAEENKRLREALERCTQIVERNNHRQNEKVDDVVHIARRALGKEPKA